jgi:2-methylisocitrate lyase-like PEP mutase family enzyme
MRTQLEKSILFKALHDSKETFIIPNTWDIGISKIITSLNFKAMATSSAAIALSQGLGDNKVSLSKTLNIHKQLCSATELPVSADFGYGFSDDPETLFKNALQLSKTGVVGMSIEDVRSTKVYSLELSIERVKAVKAAAKTFDFPFYITARADNFFIGKNNFKDTINRLQSYQLAGADVLFAPGITDKEQIKTILANIDKPLNVLAGISGFDISIEELTELGVKRISIGASLAKQFYTNAIDTLKSLKENKFLSLNATMSTSQITRVMNPSM